MPNINKVVFGSTTLIDLTDSTLSSADQLASGVTAYDRSGTLLTGTGSSGGGIIIEDTLDSHGGTVRTITAVPVKLQSTAVTPSETAQTVVPDTSQGYTGLEEVDVAAIPSDYVGSAIDERDSTDLTASGATVTVPAGYYENAASKSVASGSATAPASISGTSATVSTGTNTLTLTKSVSVTPSVTAGYVSSGTAGNSSVSLTASVTTKAAATYTPSTSTQTISANQYLTGAQTINPIPSQYIVPSGNKEITANGTGIDVAAYSTVSVNVASSGKAAQIASGFGRVNTTAYSAVTGQSITVGKTGTYDVYWVGYRSSTSGTNGSQLYVGDSAHSSGAQTTFDATYTNWQIVHLSNVSLTKDQVVTVRARARGTSYYMYVANFTIIEA